MKITKISDVLKGTDVRTGGGGGQVHLPCSSVIRLAPQSFALVFNKRALLRNKNSFLNLKIISRVSNLVN